MMKTGIRLARCMRASTVHIRRPLGFLKRGSLSPIAPASRTFASISTFPKLGQPIHETHPHLLQPGEITPGISAQEYHDRRSAFARLLPKDALAVVPGASIKSRSGPVFYDFHQDPDFLYLTGWLEPDAVAVLRKVDHDDGYEFTLFSKQNDPRVELWEGPITGQHCAVEVFNADQGFPIEQLGRQLAQMVSGQTVYADISYIFSGKGSGLLAHVDEILRRNASQVSPLKPLIHRLRVRKSPAEIAVMRRAGQISGRAFTEAMRREWDSERKLWAFLAYEFVNGGCEKEAYVPVVAGGKNGCTIHYTRNDEPLRKGQMVLVDAGGQYGGYVSDITRTWPIDGKFTPAQRDLYSAVLNAQRKCVKACTESAGITLDQVHHLAAAELEKELQLIGFDTGYGKMDVLFPHHVGHYVGLDVHDCGKFGRAIRLEEGMCVTIEPGVYVPDDSRFPEHFRNMAIRIEDDVAVGKEHPYVLNTEAVKEIVDIEALRS